MTGPHVDLQSYVEHTSDSGLLTVQPRMGMSDPDEMAAGLNAVAGARARVAGTITVDSYTRVEDIAGAGAALAAGKPLNGFPIVNHGARTTARVVSGAVYRMPVQIRHGSARPARIFEAMTDAGLAASEGGPVSYCLPYSRLPLTESVPAWRDAAQTLASAAAASGMRAHLETFGGCMLGQLCPPSLLVALSVLEGMFFAQCGLASVSLSYTQQTHAVQDIEALAALRRLAGEYLPPGVSWHIVLYTYMGVYPRSDAGAGLLLDNSARIAVRGGASRLIVKTAAEAHRIPTVTENVTALERAALSARYAATDACELPWARQVDCEAIYSEASALVRTVLLRSSDVGTALTGAFADGILDVPFCLHQDNAGVARSMIDDTGRLAWARAGAMPLPPTHSSAATVTSERLLGMLHHTAQAHDRQAVLSQGATAIPAGEVPFRIAIVGSGPRGLAVTERLAARLATSRSGPDVEIIIIDKSHVGAGRIWHPDQDESFLMNTPCDEVTMFSGPPEEGPARAGAGPSLGQWLADTGTETGTFAPRSAYGRYLSFFLDAAEASLPANVTLRRVCGEVTAAKPAGPGWRLSLADGQVLSVDRTVLATGHPITELPVEQAALSVNGGSYIRGDCAAEMPLTTIAPGATVAVIGMGLTFYDIMAALTTGRGGKFTDDGRGGLRYLPSGAEPVLVAGSRSGLPMPARGLNQKSPDWRYTARLFTPQRIAALRDGGPLDFRADVWPWLNAEMQLVYYATAVRAHCGSEAERDFADAAVREIRMTGASAAESVARDHASRAGAGLSALRSLDVDRLARPFAGARFDTAGEFAARLSAVVAEDIAEARLGNYHGPRKAALDVLRDARGTIRAAVDYGGLTAESHQRDFLGWFAPLSSFLAAGPPLFRLQEALALLDAGLLEVAGPWTRFSADGTTSPFTVSSPQVAGSERGCDLLIDARVPGPDIHRDQAPLVRQLTGSGLWTSWSNRSGDKPLDTGGVAVTDAPYHPVSVVGDPVDGLYVLGIPTEGPRWFMQVGSTRPGPWTQFTFDADAIAADILAHVPRDRARLVLQAGRR